MALEAGQSIGNYSVVRLLGEGGFGEVYLVENPLIQRRAAVKVLHPALAQDAELVRRFLNEARAASAIRHPNIVDVLDAGGTADGAPYILMEFLEGVSLQKRLVDRGRLALPQVLDIAKQAGSALAAAHAADIVHRDLKPENLFLVPDSAVPSGERVKVLDFGIAKIKHGSKTGGTVRTQSGLIMGSPAYMSPEQCKDSADVDLRSDIYSFATILYEMLTGRTPHVSASGTELLIMHLTETPRPVRELIDEVPAHVEAAIMRALARARDDRFDSMASFLDALAGATTSAVAVPTKQSRDVRPAVEVRALPAGGTAILPARTTFSRTTGEVIAADDDENLTETRRPRRLLPFAIGGMAAAGLGLFLLMQAKPSSRITTPATVVTEPAQELPPAPPRLPPPIDNLPPPQGTGAPARDGVQKHPEAPAADGTQLAQEHPAAEKGEHPKKTAKERAHNRIVRAQAQESSRQSHQTGAPTGVDNPVAASKIIKHIKF